MELSSHIRGENAPECQQTVHLWDTLAFISQQMYQLPGRRVILVVTNGNDTGSKHPWSEVRAYAQMSGVAVFGVTEVPRGVEYLGGVPGSYESPFQPLCELSGGMVLLTDEDRIEQTLKRFTAMLRERYIVEFPRPANSQAGQYGMLVKIDNSNDFIRPTGIAVPIPDATVLADPTTVPSDPSLTPKIGKRRILTNPN